MLNRVAVGLAALFMITASSLAYAEAPSAAELPSEVLSDADWKALTDRRIEIVKAALGLTPDQAKYWPAIEEAVRDRANARHLRLQKIVARLRERREGEPIDVIQLLRERADALAQRAAGLKKLADAWQPLSETLDASQKQRLRFLTLYVLREMGDRVESRRMMFEDMADED